MRSLGPVRSGRSRAAPLEEAAEKRRRPAFGSSSESTLPPLEEAFDEASHEPSDAKRDEAVASLLDILPCLEPAAAHGAPFVEPLECGGGGRPPLRGRLCDRGPAGARAATATLQGWEHQPSLARLHDL